MTNLFLQRFKVDSRYFENVNGARFALELLCRCRYACVFCLSDELNRICIQFLICVKFNSSVWLYIVYQIVHIRTYMHRDQKPYKLFENTKTEHYNRPNSNRSDSTASYNYVGYKTNRDRKVGWIGGSNTTNVYLGMEVDDARATSNRSWRFASI